MTKDFDQELKEFIKNWEFFEDSKKYTSIKRSLTYHITQELYKIFLESNSHNSNVIKRRWLRRFTHMSQFLYHVIFYCIYSLKWILILNSKGNSKFVFIYLLPNKLSSYYIDVLKFKNAKIIHFGIRTEIKYLLDKNFYCFPIFFYRTKINLDELNQLFSKIKISLSIALKYTFPNIKCDRVKLRNELIHSISMLYIIEKFFKIFSNKGKIEFLLQDMDFMSIGHLLVEISSKYNVETISIDHAITFYNHMYFNRPSDKFLVWGRYEKDRLIHKCSINEKNIFIIGHPFKKYKDQTSKISTKKNIWIYLMQSYNYPIYFTLNRTYEASIDNISRLYKEFIEVHNDGKFIVKLHPLDKISQNDLVEDRLIFSKEALSENYDEIELIIFEDTSAFIDYLGLNCELMFLSSKSNSKDFLIEIERFKQYQNKYFEDEIRLPKDQFIRKSIFDYFYADINFSNEIKSKL